MGLNTSMRVIQTPNGGDQVTGQEVLVEDMQHMHIILRLFRDKIHIHPFVIKCYTEKICTYSPVTHPVVGVASEVNTHVTSF